MKYRDPQTGELKDISVKASDTLPVGTIVEYDGDIVPAGYEKIEHNKILYQSDAGTNGDVTLSDDINNYKYIEIYYSRDKDQHYCSVCKVSNNAFNKIVTLDVSHCPTNKMIQVYYSQIILNNKSISRTSSGGGFNLNTDNGVISIIGQIQPTIHKVVGYKEV